jgi:AraC-like DNA-binding protein
VVPSEREADFNDVSPVPPGLSFQSRDLDAAVEFLRGKDLCFEVARQHRSDLDIRVGGVYLPDGLYVGLTEYGAEASIEATPRRLDYWLLIPIRGRMETAVHQRQFVSDPRRAFLFSYPSMGPSRIAVEAGASRIMVVLTHASLHRQLEALLGKPFDAATNPPLEFAPVVDLLSGCGRSIARVAQTVLADFKRGGAAARNSIALGSFEQFVINELLLSHHHNYLAAIYGRASPVAPRDLKRAINYMEANLHSAITLTDIVEASGVPGRTLLKHFQSIQGVSPMQYLRKARLEKVNETLLKSGANASVTEVAMTWGFSHLGRFSSEYRRRFGEHPSETLRRVR